MVSSVTRRRLLTVTVGGLTALTGCQSLSGLNSRIPVQIHILNTTNENIEAWIQLTDIDTGNDQAGGIGSGGSRDGSETRYEGAKGNVSIASCH